MSRAPFQVAVFPYRQVSCRNFLYAVLRRSDTGQWQPIAGGGEDGETPLDAARREAHEEAGIPVGRPFLQLDTVAPVPVTEFMESFLWGDRLYVIPQHYFAVLATQITLSREHTEYRWLTYLDACRVLRYDADKIALWELDLKVKGLGPRG